MASANTAQEYEQVIARYANTPAAADAHILLAEAQRKERKFTEANKTLVTFIAKYGKHELVSTAKMAMAANLDSMGKTDEALAMYQQIASAFPNGYAAPLAMLSQVYILKAKNRNDDARRICETMLTQYRTSIWAGEAMQQLRLLKPITTSTPPPQPRQRFRQCWQFLPRQRASPPAPNQQQTARRQRTRRWARHSVRANCRRAEDCPTPAFGELELLPRAGLPDFSLFHARIATQQALDLSGPANAST